MADIDLDRADPGFKHDVARRHGAEQIKRCYTCGVCSASCPVGANNPDFDPRRLIRLVVLGQKEEVLRSPLLWYCSTCYTCQEACPEGVNFTEVCFVLKNMAAEAGYQPPSMNAQVGLLKEHGRLYEVGEFENENRKELGLPEIEERPGHYRAMLETFKLGHGEGD